MIEIIVGAVAVATSASAAYLLYADYQRHDRKLVFERAEYARESAVKVVEARARLARLEKVDWSSIRWSQIVSEDARKALEEAAEVRRNRYNVR